MAECIFKAIQLDDPSIKPAPTPVMGYLPINEDGELPHNIFSYLSMVGQLHYLSRHLRCDIPMATSQVASWYLHWLQRLNELSLIRIGRYLKGTLDKGLILKPTNYENISIDLYDDAAFASGRATKFGTNPDAVKSLTSYIIGMANCLVLWVSKRQFTIVTSTMESEYTTLSMAPRVFIPLHHVVVVQSVMNGLHQ